MEAPRPATIEQVRRARNGRLIQVGGEVERALQDHDPNLRIRYSEQGGYYVVYEHHAATDSTPEKEELVTTALDYDMRIVAKVIAIDSERYDLVAEMDRLDAAADQAKDYAHEQKVGETGERMYHGMRRDLGIRDIF